MKKETLSDKNLDAKNFIDDYSTYILFDEQEGILTIKNLTLHSEDKNRQLLSRVISKFSPNTRPSTICLKNVEFKGGNLDLNVAEKIVLHSCSISGNDVFHGPKDLEIVDCNVPNFSLNIMDLRRLFITGSSLKKITLRPVDKELKVKTINVQNNSRIHKIEGLHWLLESGSNTVVIFSENSEVEKGAESDYRIMRVASDRFGDVVQSHIFHTKSVELYKERADKDSKILLFFERWTNNFGRSIILPVFLMLFINLLSLTVLVCFSESFPSDIDNYNITDFLVSLINISPLSSFIPESIQSTDWEFSLDSFRRIMLTILVYQTIVSARRFSFTKNR